MDIVHVDPGYGILTGTNNITSYVENDTLNPTSSFAFSTNGSKLVRAQLPNLDFTFNPTAGRLIKKVWSIKATVYYVSGNVQLGFTRSATSSLPDVGVGFTSGKCTVYHYVNGSRTNEDSGIEQVSGRHNLAITLSLTADGTASGISYTRTSIIEIDGAKDYQTATTSTLSEKQQYLTLYMSVVQNVDNRSYFSNILVGQDSYDGDGGGSVPSDEGIPYNTPIYRLPLGNPVTNFTTGENGEYVGTANGQTLLQTINTSGLSASLRNANINRIVAYGYPGYCVGSAVTSATGISKSGSTVTAHGTHALSETPTSYICDIWAIEEDSTLSDINGLQVGWRAGN